MGESAGCFFVDEVSLDEKAEKVLAHALPTLRAVYAGLQAASFEHAVLQEAFSAIGVSLGQKLSDVAQPIRAAVTGKTVSPGIFDVLLILGKEKALARLTRQINRLESIAPTA
jgi:glutamyl-tRNA synthetase